MGQHLPTAVRTPFPVMWNKMVLMFFVLIGHRWENVNLLMDKGIYDDGVWVSFIRYHVISNGFWFGFFIDMHTLRDTDNYMKPGSGLSV